MKSKAANTRKTRKLNLSFSGTFTIECPNELLGASESTLQDLILERLKGSEDSYGLKIVDVSTVTSTSKRKSANYLIRSEDGLSASSVKVVIKSDRILLVGEEKTTGVQTPLAAVRHNQGNLGVYVWQPSDNPDEKPPLFVSTRKGMTSSLN